MAIKSFNITVCASGGGGNFRSLAKHQFDCGYRISLLVVDRECFAIDVAKEYGIPYTVLYRKFLNKSFLKSLKRLFQWIQV
ncbi:hypothetical protein NXW13_07325 [Bacteroides thetaiotaomicron]|uniref:hypothetical protein n=1 Tax=Bacteroides thetaiotaomicron TaxID=818 RepID=UPI0021656141|nr:hypothetical protein [Bacteroides thetaiotaomicron]MCS2291975.1 hypothetical protein [Bacteroides thetaiotaomicron]MCS2863903.1 hypothetical protein [Bacteroides thetaiotaomicron]